MLRSSHIIGLFLFVNAEGAHYAHHNHTSGHTLLNINEVSSYQSLIDKGNSTSTSVSCSLITGIYSSYLNDTDSGIPKRDVLCVTDSQKVLKLEGDISAIALGSVSPFDLGHARLRIPFEAISKDFVVSIDDLNEVTLVIHDDNDNEDKESKPEAGGGHRRRLQDKFFGTRRVLVVLLSDEFGNAPWQSETIMFNDVFGDTNNLRARYAACSNGQLFFEPATFISEVSGVLGVVSIRTRRDLRVTYDYQAVGNEALNLIHSTPFSSPLIYDHMMFVFPDNVPFAQYASGIGLFEGQFTYLLSSIASSPLFQSHEIGHNLGFVHSTLRQTNGYFDEYGDPTCIMGSSDIYSYSHLWGSYPWVDAGMEYCFNGAWTWKAGWYKDYHHTFIPLEGLENNYYVGKLVGINAITDGVNTKGAHVVIQVQQRWVYSSLPIQYYALEYKPLYVMFNRAAGPNLGVPGHRDQVTISSLPNWPESMSETSDSMALAAGETFTSVRWNESLNHNLVIKVCSIDLSGSGSAHIMIYLSDSRLGDAFDPTCEDNMPHTRVGGRFQAPLASNGNDDDGNSDSDSKKLTVAYSILSVAFLALGALIIPHHRHKSSNRAVSEGAYSGSVLGNHNRDETVVVHPPRLA